VKGDITSVRRALISDIHGNLEALDAVLDDIKLHGIKEVFCLGDIVGYGPSPRECIDRVMDACKIALLGNHDHTAISGTDGFGIRAERANSWTREQLREERAGDERRRAFLSALQRSYSDGPFLFVHGSPRNPLSEYVFPEDVYNRRKIEALFELFDGVCFHGHTHVPGIITEDFRFLSPEEVDMEYALGDYKVMVNIGSVGQPRDGDERASYVILDDARSEGDIRRDSLGLMMPRSTKVIYRRVPYDHESTTRRIRGA
jgi:predicted phosphodiesterase